MRNQLNKFWMISLLMGLGHIAFGCDVCGGGTFGMGSSILPQWQQSQVRTSYHLLNFKHPRTDQNTVEGAPVLHDRLHRMELEWRQQKGKWQFGAKLPIVYNQRLVEGGSNQSLSGIGDLRPFVHYVLVNAIDSITGKGHFVRLGSELNLPNGKYQQRDNDKRMYPAGFQAGTGSYGVNPQLAYAYQGGFMGLTVTAGYQVFTENELGQQPGSSGMLTATAMKRWNKDQTSFIFSVSQAVEQFDASRFYSEPQYATSTTRVSAMTSFDLIRQSWWYQISSSFPIYQEVDAVQPKLTGTLSVRVARMF